MRVEKFDERFITDLPNFFYAILLDNVQHNLMCCKVQYIMQEVQYLKVLLHYG